MKKILSALIALSALSFSPSTYAKCDGCVVAAVNAAQAAITSALSNASANISSTIQSASSSSTNSIVQAISGSTQTMSTQMARAADMGVQGQQRTQAQLEKSRQEDRYMVSDACAVLSPTMGTSEAGRRVGGGGGGGSAGRGGGGGPIEGVDDRMRRAIRISQGTEQAPTPEEQAALAVPGACSSFVTATANPVRANSCTLAGFAPSVANGHPDADIRAETLFDGPQTAAKAGDFRRRLTTDGDGPEDAAIAAYLRNLNTPVDLPQLKRAELRSDNGRQYLLYRDAYEARMSLAEKPARSLVASMTANKNLLPVVEQLLESPVTGPFVQKYLDKNYPKWKQKGISAAELNNLEVERRYLNPEWHLLMASSPPEVHIKEQTTLLAFQSMQFAKILERLDQSAVLTGQMAASQVRGEMMPQLIQLHTAASR